MKKIIFFIALALASAGNLSAQVSYASIFRSWGFVGDSLCSGEMECYEKGADSVSWIDMYEYSWGQQLCRLCGSEGWNFSHGGQTARGWLNELQGQRGWGYAKENPKQAYIIALGYNDYYCSLRGLPGFSKEEFTRDIGTIVANLQSIQPDAKFFVLTRPREDDKEWGYDEWNDIIRGLAVRFDNVYVIDMFRDAPVYDQEFRDRYFLHGHLSAAGYLWTALYLMDSIDKIVTDNPEDFKNVPLIGTPWRTDMW